MQWYVLVSYNLLPCANCFNKPEIADPFNAYSRIGSSQRLLYRHRCIIGYFTEWRVKRDTLSIVVDKGVGVLKSGKARVARGRRESSNSIKIQTVLKKKKNQRKNHVSCITCHVSQVMFHVSLVSCHLRKQPQPQTLPMETPPLCTVGWFAKTQKTFFFLHKILSQNFKAHALWPEVSCSWGSFVSDVWPIYKWKTKNMVASCEKIKNLVFNLSLPSLFLFSFTHRSSDGLNVKYTRKNPKYSHITLWHFRLPFYSLPSQSPNYFY